MVREKAGDRNRQVSNQGDRIQRDHGSAGYIPQIAFDRLPELNDGDSQGGTEPYESAPFQVRRYESCPPGLESWSGHDGVLQAEQGNQRYVNQGRRQRRQSRRSTDGMRRYVGRKGYQVHTRAEEQQVSPRAINHGCNL